MGMLIEGNFPEGFCKVSYPSQNKYATFKGLMREGDFDGYGRLTMKSGLPYEGVFKDNILVHVKANYTTESDAVMKVVCKSYEGDIVGGMRSGEGRMEFGDGVVYEGSWEQGLMARWGI